MELPVSINIRVYALLIRKGKVLLTDEYRFGQRMTKFPGGGLHLGEGTIECLKREIREEMQAELRGIQHFYTTDYYQPARFVQPTQQIMNIYYRANLIGDSHIDYKVKPFDYPEEIEGAQCFRWVEISSLRKEDLTLPIDKVVLKHLKEAFIES